MYRIMKPLFLLPLLLLTGAGPATQPAPVTDRYVVQVRRIEYTLKPGEAAPTAPGERGVKLPASAVERSTIQVTAAVGLAFETVAVVEGRTYRLGGRLTRVTSDASRVAVEVDYGESMGDPAVSLSQITSGVMATVNEPMQLGGLAGEAGGYAIILTVNRGGGSSPPLPVSASARP